MPKKKKTLIIVIIVLLIALLAFLLVVVIIPKIKASSSNGKVATFNSQTSNQIEDNFLNLFSNIDYSQKEQDIVTTAYALKKDSEDNYQVDVHFPRINFDTCEEINNEIIEKLGGKLLALVEVEGELTKYKVDYITYTNDGIISIIIKCVLKEGKDPQRVMVQTYNYDVDKEKLVTLEEVMESKNLESRKVQTQINNVIRKKSESTKNYEGKGYNIYVRDINSNMYEIQNINNFFLDENGDLYVIFAYGNNNFTETIDVIKIS